MKEVMRWILLILSFSGLSLLSCFAAGPSTVPLAKQKKSASKHYETLPNSLGDMHLGDVREDSDCSDSSSSDESLNCDATSTSNKVFAIDKSFPLNDCSNIEFETLVKIEAKKYGQPKLIHADAEQCWPQGGFVPITITQDDAPYKCAIWENHQVRLVAYYLWEHNEDGPDDLYQCGLRLISFRLIKLENKESKAQDKNEEQQSQRQIENMSQ